MAFMQQQVTFGIWTEVDTTQGIDFIPSDLTPITNAVLANKEIEEPLEADGVMEELQQYCEGKPQTVEAKTGWGARLSAPGYMDCTEWSVYDTQDKAKEALEDMYGDDDEEDADEASV